MLKADGVIHQPLQAIDEVFMALHQQVCSLPNPLLQNRETRKRRHNVNRLFQEYDSTGSTIEGPVLITRHRPEVTPIKIIKPWDSGFTYQGLPKTGARSFSLNSKGGYMVRTLTHVSQTPTLHTTLGLDTYSTLGTWTTPLV